MKSFIANQILPILFWPLRQFSPKLRAKIFKELIRLSSDLPSPKRTLRFFFELENHLYNLESGAAKNYGKGIHPKHKYLNYHQFFIKNLKSGESVLDIGCGNGIVDYDIAKNVSNIQITGIDLNKENIKFARKHYKHPSLTFIYGDALKSLPNQSFDIVILSNVLEHFKNRVVFLKKIKKIIKPKRLLIRVPLFERDWRVPFKKELSVDYRLDPTHYIEYTKKGFKEEMKKANIKIISMKIRWGEIWAVGRPFSSRA